MGNGLASDYMTTKQVAEIFDVTPKTVGRWRALGLPCAHIGRNNYYRAADVREFIDSRIEEGKVRVDPQAMPQAEPQGSGSDGE